MQILLIKYIRFVSELIKYIGVQLCLEINYLSGGLVSGKEILNEHHPRFLN